jgi:hypothetical protein
MCTEPSHYHRSTKVMLDMLTGTASLSEATRIEEEADEPEEEETPPALKTDDEEGDEPALSEASVPAVTPVVQEDTAEPVAIPAAPLTLEEPETEEEATLEETTTSHDADASTEGKTETTAQEGETKVVVDKWGVQSATHKYWVIKKDILVQGALESEVKGFCSKVLNGQFTDALYHVPEAVIHKLLYSKESCLERGYLDGIDLEEHAFSNLSKHHTPGFFARILFGDARRKADTTEMQQWRNRFESVAYGKILKDQPICAELAEELKSSQVLISGNALTQSGELAAAFFSLVRHTASKSKYAPIIMQENPVEFVNTCMFVHNVFLANCLKQNSQRYLTASKASDF